MRKLIIVALAAALSACVQPGGQVPTSPSEVAQRTVADDIAMRGVLQLYAVSLHLLEVAADTKALKGPNAAKAIELKSKLDQGVGIARTAYKLSNSAGLVEAYNNIIVLSGQVVTVTGGSQ